MKKLLLMLAALMLGLMLGGCGGDKSPGSDMQLTLGLMPDTESIPLVVAEMEGYFDDEGVDVTLIHFKSARDRDSALQSGELDGVVTDMVSVFFNNEGGIPLQATARTNGRLALMAGKNSGITEFTAGQVADKTLGLSLNTVMEYTADSLLAGHGLSVDAQYKTAVPQIPTRMEMLQGGQLDMAIMPDPFVSMALADGALLLTDTTGFEHTAGVFAFHRDVIQERPEAVKAVMRAFEAAVADLNQQGIEPWKDNVIENMGLPEASHELLVLPAYNSAVPTEETFQAVQGWMHDKELITEEYAYGDIVVNWEQF
ncbi:MAG: MetQ/NlpA family ABC transporter substrate-binding protein [Syntrophomonadaceae bacterium]|nr:MetQ/NlpA family ABC transporter substrate-binding protein [Syntrophomonadaceae bacterium]